MKGNVQQPVATVTVNLFGLTLQEVDTLLEAIQGKTHPTLQALRETLGVAADSLRAVNSDTGRPVRS